VGSRGPTPRPVLDRILDRIEIGDPCECWPIDGACHDGYPVITVGSRADDSRTTVNVHTLLYDLVVGDAEPDQVKDHLCRFRRCGNPDHIEPVSNVENVMRGDGLPARRARSSVCEEGHEFTPENTVWQLSGDGHRKRRCRICKRKYDKEQSKAISLSPERRAAKARYLREWRARRTTRRTDEQVDGAHPVAGGDV
jgi:hypothetical protein